MKTLLTTVCLTIAVLLGVTGCQTTNSFISYIGVRGERLPPCSGYPTDPIWTNCHGQYYLSNGEKYIGEILNGKPHGQGTATFSAPSPHAGYKSVGQYKDGKLHGQGTATFSAPHKMAGEKQVGKFKDGKLHGQGTGTFSAPHKLAGEKQVGEFKDGKLHGQGTATFSAPHKFAGQKYVGNFKEGLRSGPGTHTHADGRIEEGIWKNDKLQYAQKVTPTVTAEKSSPPSPSAAYLKGLTAAQNGDFATALHEWTPLAKQGNESAQYGLGVMYKEGKGVPQNDKTAD